MGAAAQSRQIGQALNGITPPMGAQGGFGPVPIPGPTVMPPPQMPMAAILPSMNFVPGNSQQAAAQQVATERLQKMLAESQQQGGGAPYGPMGSFPMGGSPMIAPLPFNDAATAQAAGTDSMKVMERLRQAFMAAQRQNRST